MVRMCTLQMAGGLTIGIVAITTLWIPTMTAGGRGRFESEVAAREFEQMDDFAKEYYETTEELAASMVRY